MRTFFQFFTYYDFRERISAGAIRAEKGKGKRRASRERRGKMEKYIVEGGRPLYGEVEIQSAKNAVLPLLAAAVLVDGEVILRKCARIRDVMKSCESLDSGRTL